MNVSEIVQQIKDDLSANGSCQFTDPMGRRMMLVASSQLSFVDHGTPSILVAYEGEGAFLWDISVPMNTFLLIEHGFSLRLAPTLSGVLNGLIEPSRTGITPKLEGPRAAEKGD